MKKNCKYCLNADYIKNITNDNMLCSNSSAYIDGNELVVDTACDDDYYDDTLHIPMKFCPMCGRKLN